MAVPLTLDSFDISGEVTTTSDAALTLSLLRIMFSPPRNLLSSHIAVIVILGLDRLRYTLSATAWPLA